jgi:type I restriction enzyme S subunit
MISSVPEGWKLAKLSHFIEEFVQKTTLENEFEVLTSSKNGLTKQSDYYGENRITRRSNIGFNVIPENYITYRSRSDNNRFTFNQNTLGFTGIISKYYPVFTSIAGIEYNQFLLNLINYHSQRFSLESVGTSQLVLSYNAVKSVKLPIPPLPEQKKIAAILTSVDTVIEKTQAQINKLKDLKTGMMQELLTKGIGHTEFKDSPVGRIPVEWEYAQLKSYCKRVCVGFVGTCEKYYCDDGIPMIRTGNLKHGHLNLNDVKQVTKEFHYSQKKSQLKEGDLLIARHGHHGEACLVPPTLTEANCLNVVIVKVDRTNYVPIFLKYLFNSDAMKASFDAKSEGSTQKVISTTEIANSIFPKPSINEQKRIADILLSIDGRIDLYIEKLSSIQYTKKALMQDLLTGKVRVNV